MTATPSTVRAAIDLRQLRVVARFELAEALRSRLVTLVLVLYGAGAAVGAYIFSQTLEAAEAAVRDSLLGSFSAAVLPADVVREQALPRVISFLVDDEALRRDLVGVEPLAIFYGFMALNLVSGLVLMTSGGAHASDVASGATRFVLTRCNRLTWALGKLLGHAVLLAIGLLVGALTTALVAYVRTGLDAASVLWLLRAAFRAWIYGLTYLGIFAGVSLCVRVPARARALSVALLFGLWLAHALTGASWFAAWLPGAQHLVWLFPGQYEQALWSPSWFESVPAIVMLLAIGLGAFGVGVAVFRRADA